MDVENPDGPRLFNDKSHAKKCRDRWVKRANRPGYPAFFANEQFCRQCGACRFFVRLTGEFRKDWGVCSNPESPMDGKVCSEHDGCQVFSRADEDWDYPDI